MGETKDLSRQEAIAKLKHLAEDIGICMFCTYKQQPPMETRPMSIAEVDANGDCWFLSGAHSNKNQEIGEQSDVQLIFADRNDAHFLSVYGKAEVLRDRKKIEEVWSNFAKAWFKEGKNDPEITAIRVRPQQAHYWDTKHGRMVSLLKIAIATISGKVMDDGVEGELRV